ncbi:MAG: hypothetical protein ACSHXD_16085 [Marinosulfonomonas sp.]
MNWIIWPGAVVALLGVAGLVYCILSAAKIRKQELEEEEMKARLQKLVAMNLGALFVSTIGLMLVIVGILLG